MTDPELKKAAQSIVESVTKTLIAKWRKQNRLLMPQGTTLAELRRLANPSFPPKEAPNYAKHFEPDEEGFYRSDLHKMFKLTVKEFAKRTGLVRVRNYLPLESRWEIVRAAEDMDEL